MNENPTVPIHNFCDRWCERCFLTSKCAIFENTSGLTTEELDARNEDFWNTLGQQLDQTINLLREAAQKHGVDLENIEDDSESRRDRWLRNKSHPSAKLSNEYGMAAHQWLKEKSDLIRKTPAARNSLEVIAWYELFIHVKIMRALSTRFSEEEFEDDQKDYNGSAKITLIAIERSMKAWQTIVNLDSTQAADVVRFILMLEKLQSMVETEFPNAWNFIRPGFDEG